MDFLSCGTEVALQIKGGVVSRVDANVRKQLTTRFASKTCTLDQECQYKEVLLCHYQRSKHHLEALPGSDSQKTMELINDG